MGGRRGETEVPGDEVPYNRSQQASQDHTGIHHNGIDQPPAHGLCHRGADHECRYEVEEGGPDDCHAGAEDPGGDYGGDRVGAVVEAVDEVEGQSDCDDGQDVHNFMAHAQLCLIEMDSSTLPASSMWSRVFSRVS